MDQNAAILIVCDSEYMRDYIQKALKFQGYPAAIEAVDGKDALDSLMEHKVDLIISELQMPKVSGLDLVKAMANHSTLKKIPCMILTSDTSDDGFKQAMEAGAADYIKKPFTSSELDIKIKSIDKNQ
ncbi:MAG: response regulator [Desulfobacterales bacterium]|nr:response regulator [Desulfobacterales bacterium]